LANLTPCRVDPYVKSGFGRIHSRSVILAKSG
jgi:hypothetical protein